MPKHSKSKKAPQTARAEAIDFEVDPKNVERVSKTMCPFGDGLACDAPGCMVCDGGARCCSPGETCYLKEQDVTNWCTGFRGADLGGTVWENDEMVRAAANANAAPGARSFWERT